jgi:hypothetical protein
MAGDENKNVGILTEAILTQPEKSMGTWVACESEHLSCRQWVAAFRAAARRQGVRKTIVYEECSIRSMEEAWGILGNEIGQMMLYISETGRWAFENTSGLPEIKPERLGVELFDTRAFYEQFDCVALMRQVDNEEVHLGTVSR